MSPTYSNQMPEGTMMPAFELPGTDGNTYSPSSFADAEILVVEFTCNHCPYAIAVEDRLIQLQADFVAKGVQFILINANDAVQYPEDSFPNMVLRATEKHFPFPYLYDETQEAGRAYNAACTPDVFVFDSRRILRYNGRIDDNWQQPDQVTQQDLRIVLEDVLAGRDISIDPVPSIGCSIKWK
ncbi:MAG: thioredoxin family protein [Bacteroidota bacterium]